MSAEIPAPHDFAFETPNCPKCGEPAAFVVEKMFALAGIAMEPGSFRADYIGETEVLWDTQTPYTPTRNDTCTIQCASHHEWASKFLTDA